MIEIFKIYYFILIIGSAYTSYYVYVNNNHYGYEYLFVLPLLFALFSLFLFWSKEKSIVINLIYLLYFARFVILSFFIVYSGWYEGRATFSPQKNSFDNAILLMALEFLLLNTFYYIFLRKKDINLYKTNLSFKFKDNTLDIIYFMFIFISILLSPLISSQINILGFNNQIPQEMNQLQTLIFFFIYVSKYLLIGLSIKYFYRKYCINNKAIYILLSLIITIFINSIFLGNNRMDFVLPFIATFIVLNYLYKRKMIIYNILSVFFLITSLYIISLARGTFDYRIVENTASLFTDYLQIYLAGVYNVALSLEIVTSTNQNVFITFIYDLVRPFLGLNLIWRSDSLYTSAELFNQRIFGFSQTTQIIPLIGQFYLPFGILGLLISVSLLILIMNIMLRYLRGIYFVNAIIIFALLFRIIITPVQNLSIFINEFSSIALIVLSLNLINIIIKMSYKK